VPHFSYLFFCNESLPELLHCIPCLVDEPGIYVNTVEPSAVKPDDIASCATAATL
jgi:hypothetical protein